jgi:hypothetical protein
MLVANEAESSQRTEVKKYNVITRYYKFMSEEVKFSLAPGTIGKTG